MQEGIEWLTLYLSELFILKLIRGADETLTFIWFGRWDDSYFFVVFGAPKKARFFVLRFLIG